MSKRRPTDRERTTSLDRRSFLGGALATTLAAALLPTGLGGVVKDAARGRRGHPRAHTPRWLGHF